MGAIYFFGDWELDEPLFELRRAGKRVGVQPKVLRLLLLLVENHERVVPHDELLSVLWPDEKVTPASIRRAVRAARRALGDGDESQANISTVRGRGYRFVQDVQTKPPASSIRAVSSSSDPFVGRAALLARVDGALADVTEGRTRTLWLSGVPGIGKSRALEEIGDRCRLYGFEVLFGRCLEADGAPAFWPWFQMLRHCLLGRGVESFRELLGTGAASVAEGVPELREWIAGVPVTPRIDSAEARFRFFESMVLFLERASSRAPLAILFDDLTRADAPSLRLLAFAVQQIRGARIFVVGTLRTPCSAGGAFTEALSEMIRQDSAALFELEAFSRDEVARYFEVRGGAALGAGTVSALFDRTAGNPLYCRQLLELSRTEGAALGEGALFPAGGVRHQGLLRAIERHLDVVSAECRRALRVASVFGREFSVSVLALVLDAGQCKVEGLIDEALRAGLLVRGGDGERRVRFQHSLVRDVLYDELPPEERHALHARAGDALEAARATPAEVSAAVLSHHFLEALPFRNDGKALEYTRVAALEASECLAYEEAVRHFDRALGIIGAAEGHRAERLWLLMGKGEVLNGLDAVLARRTLLEAAALADQLGCTESLARVAVAFAASSEPGEVDRERVALFERTLTRLPEDDERYPVVQALLSRSLLYSGDLEERGRLSHAALASARRFSDPAVLGQTLRLCHEALAEPQHLPLRRRFSDELVRVARSCSSVELSIHAGVTQVQDYLELGDLGVVGDAIASLERPSDGEKRPLARWFTHVFSSMRAYVAGEFEATQKHADAALAMRIVVGEEFALHGYCVQVSGVWRLIGHSAKAYELVRRVSERYPALPGWCAVMAGLDAELGRRDRAERELARLMEDDVAAIRREPYSMSALCPLAELCTFVGTPAQARKLYELLLPFEYHHGVVSFGVATHGPVARHLGMLASRMGDAAAAERHFEAALAISEAMPSPTYIALTCLSHARALARSQGTASSKRESLLRRTLTIADQTGMSAIGESCRYHLQGSVPGGLVAAPAR